VADVPVEVVSDPAPTTVDTPAPAATDDPTSPLSPKVRKGLYYGLIALGVVSVVLHHVSFGVAWGDTVDSVAAYLSPIAGGVALAHLASK
jgi:hypothetical protein